MKESLDIRWKQRFSTYKKALSKLTIAVELIRNNIDLTRESKLNDNDELQLEGLIQRFEYTQELAWKVMVDYLKFQGYQDIKGSRDAFRNSLRIGIITSDKWMNTIEDRNRTSHTYDDVTAYDVMLNIINIYYPLFVDFEKRMDTIDQ